MPLVGFELGKVETGNRKNVGRESSSTGSSKAELAERFQRARNVGKPKVTPWIEKRRVVSVGAS